VPLAECRHHPGDEDGTERGDQQRAGHGRDDRPEQAEGDHAHGEAGQSEPHARTAAEPPGQRREDRAADQRTGGQGDRVQAGHCAADALLVAQQRDDRREAVQEVAPDAQLQVDQPGGRVAAQAGHGLTLQARRRRPGLLRPS